MSIPTVDLNGFLQGALRVRTRIAETVDRTLQDNGFMLVRGHGIPDELVTDTQRVTREFFSLPMDEKMRVAQPSPTTMRGYVAMGRESLSYSRDQAAPPDLNESFMIGQSDPEKMDGSFAPNRWPQRPAQMRPLWAEYYRQMERVGAELVRVLAVALGVAEDFFEEKFAMHNSRLRARHYPSQSAAPPAGQLRAGAHTDYGSLAIVLTEDRLGGLQVRERSGRWLEVPVVEGCLIVNIGDLMARWTNDRWPAALHHVANPPREADGSARFSHIFFQSPNEDTLVECFDVCCGFGNPPKYAPVLASDYLRMKFQKVQPSGVKSWRMRQARPLQAGRVVVVNR